jgi:hypothetical protein
MQSYSFNPDLSNADQYTHISEIQPLCFYNIIGVLINYNSIFQIGNGEILLLINSFIKSLQVRNLALN